MKDIPLNILIIDSEKFERENLKSFIIAIKNNFSVQLIDNVDQAEEIISKFKINSIFIDPISINLDTSEKFIFRMREKFPHIVFVLYYDFDEQFENYNELFKGQRGRLNHYFKLNKGSRESEFPKNVARSIYQCQAYLASSIEMEPIDRLKTELNQIKQKADNSQLPSIIPNKLFSEILDQLDQRLKDIKTIVDPENWTLC